ncbi:GNAT family N-acetyltransferase [bacterium]|nr:GNAT family N-acetyltransferase [bacterium]
MEIRTITNTPKTTFTSLKSPIQPVKILSQMGEITMQEATKTDIEPVAKLIRKKETLSYKIRHLYGPREKTRQAREEFKAMNKYQWLKDIKNMLNNMLQKPDGNSSLLVAKNKDGKVIGFATMQSLDGVSKPIGVIDNAYLEYQYRNENIGEHLLFNILKAAKNQFTHVVTKIIPLDFGHNSYYSRGFRTIPKDSPDAEFLHKKFDTESHISWGIKKIQ